MVCKNFPGRFNVYNALAAFSVGLYFGVDIKIIKEALKNVKVLGRLETVQNELELTIMIDYAHSPKSLESILTSIKYYIKGRIILVFGCGGNRDAGKRPIMGEIAGKLADYTVITSDNPRNENALDIMYRIEEGILNTEGKYICIENRKEAIKYAINMASKNDIILLCRKRSRNISRNKRKKISI